MEDKNVYCHEDLQVFDWPNMLTALVNVLDNLNFGWRGLDILLYSLQICILALAILGQKMQTAKFISAKMLCMSYIF